MHEIKTGESPSRGTAAAALRRASWTAAGFGLLLCLWMLCGCRSFVYDGAAEAMSGSPVQIFLPPFANATDDEHASRALTELTASALYDRGLPVVQAEPMLVRARAIAEEETSDGLYADVARALGATHLLIGTVHEYRYKTDLDGDPVVGITLRLADATTGRTLWQGSSGRVSVLFASLSSAAQQATRALVARMPLPELVPEGSSKGQ